jgi:hypothetical protein
MKTWHNNRHWLSAMASGLLLAAAPQASAQVPNLNVRSLAAVDYNNPDPSGPTQQVQSVNETSFGPTFSTLTAQADAAASGGTGGGRSRAYFGSLGVYALASTSNPAGPANSAVRQSASTGSSSWRDSATVAGLDQFTLVDIQVNVVVDVAAFSIATSPNANTQASLDFTAHNNRWCVATMEALCPDGTSPLVVGRNELSLVFQAYGGSTLTIGADMSASAVVVTYSETTAFASTALVDAINSAHSYYTVLTPGATLNWASGHDYNLPAVPEPATYATLLAGLGLLSLRRRMAR